MGFFTSKKKRDISYPFTFFLALLIVLSVGLMLFSYFIGIEIPGQPEPVQKFVQPVVKPVIPVKQSVSDLDALKRGEYRVKKIEDLVIPSRETINGEKVELQVYIDVYYPKLANPDPKIRFPVVIITHPTITLSMAPGRKQYDYLANHLTSRGFIVVLYEWSGDINQCEVFRNAEREASIVEYLEKKNLDEYSPFWSRVNTDKMGLVGHSNGSFAQHFDKIEPRVKGFVGLAGMLCEWGGFYDDIADLKQPFLYIGGSKDQLRANTKRLKFFELWDRHVGPKVMFDIIDGDHWQFTDDFVYYPDVILHYSRTDNLFKNLYAVCRQELSDYNETNDEHCDQDLVPREIQHKVTKYFVTAFFERYLNDKMEFDQILKNPDPEIGRYLENFELGNF